MATRRRVPSVSPRKRARYSKAATHNTRKGVLGREASNIGKQTIAADTAVRATRASSMMRVGAGIKFVITMRTMSSTLRYRVHCIPDYVNNRVFPLTSERSRNTFLSETERFTYE